MNSSSDTRTISDTGLVPNSNSSPCFQTKIQQVSPQPQPQQTQIPIIMAQPMKSENICCITTRSWSNLIAWVQIISGALGILTAIVLLANLGSNWGFANTSDYRETVRETAKIAGISESVLDGFVEKITGKIYLEAVVFAVLLLVLSGIGLVMGAMLHHGVSREKPMYLSLWIILTAVSTVFLGVGSVIAICVIAKNFRANASIFLANVFVNLLSLWFVWKHRAEMVEYDARMTQPHVNPSQHTTTTLSKA